MAKKQNEQLTSVKVNSEMFEEFKVVGIRTKMNLNKLVDRSLYLYLTNEEFRQTIHNQLNTAFKSGSI